MKVLTNFALLVVAAMALPVDEIQQSPESELQVVLLELEPEALNESIEDFSRVERHSGKEFLPENRIKEIKVRLFNTLMRI